MVGDKCSSCGAVEGQFHAKGCAIYSSEYRGSRSTALSSKTDGFLVDQPQASGSGEAPERLWAAHKQGKVTTLLMGHAPFSVSGLTEYVRADLATTPAPQGAGKGDGND